MKDLLKIFVDTDAFVALAREDDANHEKAIILLNQFIEQSITFFTSNNVFSESITILSVRKSHEAAVQFIHAMQSPENQYILKRTDEELEEEAIHLFQEQTSKNTSFADCTTMAFMKKLHADAIFSFDRVYKTNGFLLLEDFLAKESEQAA
jgi:predicted nucleic acid-binding protein